MTSPPAQHEGTFVADDGLRFFERWWSPAGAPKAAIAIVHGYAEHSGRYDYAGRFLAERGYAVDAFDLRGHGHSAGARVLVRSNGEYLADLDVFLARTGERHPEAPLFLLGHSMGGAIVTLAVLRGLKGVAGVVLSGPSLRARQATPRLVQELLLLVARLAPGLRLGKLDAADVSRDPEVVARYDSDPLVYRGRMPLGTLAAMVRAGREITRRMEEFSLPVLLMHGSADNLTHPDGSRELYERASAADKTLKLYDGLYHEILNEPEKDQVLADLAAWLDSRVAAPD